MKLLELDDVPQARQRQHAWPLFVLYTSLQDALLLLQMGGSPVVQLP